MSHRYYMLIDNHNCQFPLGTMSHGIRALLLVTTIHLVVNKTMLTTHISISKMNKIRLKYPGSTIMMLYSKPHIQKSVGMFRLNVQWPPSNQFCIRVFKYGLMLLTEKTRSRFNFNMYSLTNVIIIGSYKYLCPLHDYKTRKLIQIIAWGLFGMKPLPERILASY